MGWIIAIWIACMFICGIVAPAKGRSGGWWGLAGLIFGIVPVIILAMMPALPRKERGRNVTT